MTLSKLTLNEYRLTQNLVWADVLANEIAQEIFEDGLLSPEEEKMVDKFMKSLSNERQMHFKNHIRAAELETFKESIRRSGYLGISPQTL